MKCPNCGGRLVAKHTESTGECVIRFRKCEKCGRTVKTVEEIARE